MVNDHVIPYLKEHVEQASDFEKLSFIWDWRIITKKRLSVYMKDAPCKYSTLLLDIVCGLRRFIHSNI